MADLPRELKECFPETADGIRRLATIASLSDIEGVRFFLDELELKMLRALRIKPESVGYDRDDEVTPVQIEHIRRRGLRVRWTKRTTCEECRGKGYLYAKGATGNRFDVECPECSGFGKVESDSEDIYTDIDGNAWKKAA